MKALSLYFLFFIFFHMLYQILIVSNYIKKAYADLSLKADQTKVAATKSRREAGGKAIQEESIKMVKAGSGCEDSRKIKQKPNSWEESRRESKLEKVLLPLQLKAEATIKAWLKEQM
ncbi:Hypothetical predicted protein [Olea europaea subsp. europaea]|uniref:Uncharacterized protein n=1 Tax=Olea europaea subsp. europaea TaxID=158383 RepID=A0A8S0TUS1_OLEEU|nr:Hypothetical predicted protein [Olea europaea subsp. europaea]